MDLTDDEIWVLMDMVGEWSDKDRHGLLRSEWSYDDDQISATSSLHAKVINEAKKRGLWWAQ